MLISIVSLDGSLAHGAANARASTPKGLNSKSTTDGCNLSEIRMNTDATRLAAETASLKRRSRISASKWVYPTIAAMIKAGSIAIP